MLPLGAWTNAARGTAQPTGVAADAESTSVAGTPDAPASVKEGAAPESVMSTGTPPMEVMNAFAEGEGPKAYKVLTEDARFARWREYFANLKERESFKKTWDEVSGM